MLLKQVCRMSVIMIALFVIVIPEVCAAPEDSNQLAIELSQEREALTLEHESKMRQISQKICEQVNPELVDFRGFILPFTIRDAPGEKKSPKEPGNGAIVDEVLNDEASGGLAPGDMIERFDGIAIDSAAHLKAISHATRDVLRPYVNFKRNHKTMSAQLGMSSDQFYLPFRLSLEDGEISSYLTGHEAVIGSALIRFTENDDQIAFIIAHEVAHYVRRDNRVMISDTRKNSSAAAAEAIVGAAFKALLDYDPGHRSSNHNVMAGPYKKIDESGADEYALYLMEKAGFDPGAGFDILGRIHTELENSRNRYSKTYDQIHPVDIDRISLADKAIQESGREFLRKQARSMRKRVTPGSNDLLGSTNNQSIDHSEYRLTDVDLQPAPGLTKEGRVHVFFPSEFSRLRWAGVIKETYQLFEVGWINVELIDSHGKLRAKCKNSYAVTPPCLAHCTLEMIGIPKEELSGVWTLRAMRSDVLIDERKIFFAKPIVRKRIIKKRSEVLSQAASSNNL